MSASAWVSSASRRFSSTVALSASAFPLTLGWFVVYVALTDGHGETLVQLRLVDVDEAQAPLFELEARVDLSDPLAHLELTTSAYREAAKILHGLAHEAAGGRWIATGGGGYQWASVVPRAWTIYFAEMAEAELPDELPGAWLRIAEQRGARDVPTTLTDPRP